MVYDCVIIGGGPAGLSAALYTTRAGLKTLILKQGGSALEKAHLVENYFGFAEPISGAALLEQGEKNAARLGASLVEDEALSLLFEEGVFTVAAKSGESYGAKTVLLATGKATVKAPLSLDDHIGRGVSRCAVCDGFFFKNRPVAVLGAGPYALSEAEELAGVASSVTIFTNGKQPAFDAPAGIAVNTEPIEKPLLAKNAMTNADIFSGFALKNGEEIPLAAVFIALGTPGASDFAAKLGIAVEKGVIGTDEKMMTNLPGVFAAGDCTGAPYQVSVSVGRGAVAGLGMTEFVKKKRA